MPRRSISHVAVLVLALIAHAPARAQTGPTIAGAALGATGGALVTMGIVTAAARAGRYLFSPDDVRWELVPVPLGAVTGGVMGYRNEDRLWRAVGHGALGLGAGTAVGALVGHLVWGEADGVWSGAVIGASLGLVVGSVLGARSWEPDGGGPPPVLSVSLPVGR